MSYPEQQIFMSSASNLNYYNERGIFISDSVRHHFGPMFSIGHVRSELLPTMVKPGERSLLDVILFPVLRLLQALVRHQG